MESQTKSVLPYLAAAIICDRLLDEKDGTVSCIRLIDKVTIQVMEEIESAIASGKLPAVAVPIHALFSFKRGEATKSDFDLKVDIEGPSGNTTDLISHTLHFKNETVNCGANVMVRGDIPFSVKGEGGVYWFRVFLDQQLVTKAPFLVEFVKNNASPTTPAE